MAARWRQLDLDQEAAKEIEPLVPFLSAIAELETARRRFEFADGQAAATKLSEINARVAEVRAKMEKLVGKEDSPDRPKKTLGRCAALAINTASRTLQNWYEFYHGYDPVVGWWIETPYKKLDASLTDYSKFLRQKVAGLTDAENAPVIGSPIGRAALEGELAAEMIPYDPERLLKLAEGEFDWCQEQMIAAAQRIGLR